MRDRLIGEDPASEQILKPVLRGRDIARYRANWKNLWLIGTFPSLNLDIDDYPAVKKHLMSIGKQRLAQEGLILPDGRRSRKRTPHGWYELQDTCAYHEKFKDEKLFWMHMSPNGRFAYSPSEMYCNQKAFLVTGKRLKYLCAVLNSTPISSFMRQYAVTTGMGLIQWDKFSVEKIPVPEVSDSEEVYIERLVDHIFSSKTSHPVRSTAREEEDIDNFVIQKYGFTGQEIHLIQNSIKR